MVGTLTRERALTLPEVELRRELQVQLAANPARRLELDPYADGEHSLVRDLMNAALRARDTAARRRVLLHRVLGDHVSGDFAMGGYRNLPGLVDINPVTAAPFLNTYAVVTEPWSSMPLPAMPTVVPARQAADKTPIAGGGRIGQQAPSSNPVTVAWGGDVAMQVVERAPASWLQVLWNDVGAAVFAEADREAIADVAGATGVATATDIVAAVGAAVAAQPSERPPLVLLSTLHADQLTNLRDIIAAGIATVVLSATLPAGLVALVVGGRAVIASRTNLEVVQANDVNLVGANLAWVVQYNVAVRAPGAVVTVTGP